MNDPRGELFEFHEQTKRPNLPDGGTAIQFRTEAKTPGTPRRGIWRGETPTGRLRALHASNGLVLGQLDARATDTPSGLV